jgi:hypothetical protein
MLLTDMKPGRELSRDCDLRTSPYATNATGCRRPSELVGNENRPLTDAMQGRLLILAIKGVCRPC